MSSLRFALAACLLSAAGSAGAGVAVIELTPSMHAAAPALAGSGPQTGGAAVMRTAYSATLAAPRAALAAQPAAVPPMQLLRADTLVAERRQPPSGALLLLLAGCVVYLARHRGPGFSLRPAQRLA